MKRALFVLLLILPVLFAHAQQPPPKNPKDPDTAAIDPDSAALIDPPIRIAKPDPQQIFTAVEHEPEFPGGFKEFYKFLARNIKYPKTAGDTNGKVFLQFIVEKDGKLSNIHVVRSLGPEFDAEALRVIKLSPKWTPGIQNGKHVRVLYNLPINFSLE